MKPKGQLDGYEYMYLTTYCSWNVQRIMQLWILVTNTDKIKWLPENNMPENNFETYIFNQTSILQSVTRPKWTPVTKAGLNMFLPPTLHAVVNNIVQHCYTWLRLNSIVYCWQLQTMYKQDTLCRLQVFCCLMKSYILRQQSFHSPKEREDCCKVINSWY